MAAEFVDIIHLQDSNAHTQLTVAETEVDGVPYLHIQAKGHGGRPVDLHISRGDAVLLAERIRMLALYRHVNRIFMPTDDETPDL